MKKELLLDNGNKYILTVDDCFCGEILSINKGYFEKEKLIKTLQLSIWDDMSFKGYLFAHDSNIIEFEFDINDPLYFCLNKLLGIDKELTIDDDDTSEIMKKYMIISKEEKTIKIIFVNSLEKPDIIDTFRVFIKNIGPDPRSKIEDYNTKIRLIEFLRDCRKVLTEEYHQVTNDEHIEILRQKELEKEKQLKLKKV